MRVEAFQVSCASTHSSTDATAVVDETLLRPRTSDPATAAVADTVQLSGSLAAAGDREDFLDLTPKQRLAVLAIEALLGHRIHLLRYHPSATVAVDTTATPAGTELVHQRTELHYEAEQTNFQAQGVVETADGRRIQFSVELAMQREFQSATSTTGSGNTLDPLVVNYGGTPARLTGAKVSFDLNADGTSENISFVADGSGFLVLDGNSDGQVNDGSELFGTRTGDGFAELAAYDADGNGWIDAGDPVFTKLRLWTGDGLSTLSEKGIGAIATFSADTPFAIKDDTNALQANVLSTGVYLSEDGTAGTVQQVDLATG